VKQRCESEQFIIINYNLKRFARDYYIKWKEGGKRARQWRDRESMCVRGRAVWREEDSIGNKIDP
jgi:hypothetical protein